MQYTVNPYPVILSLVASPEKTPRSSTLRRPLQEISPTVMPSSKKLKFIEVEIDERIERCKKGKSFRDVICASPNSIVYTCIHVQIRVESGSDDLDNLGHLGHLF